MPRLARLDAPGVLYHVMGRGIERRKIFWDKKDREDFVDRLASLSFDNLWDIYAWVFMANHFHLMVRVKNGTLATIMRKLLTGYAVNFNKRHRRHGHLFQNRYKSIVCQEDTYLMELVRYIHLNPLRGGIVKNIHELNGYPWSGHSAILGEYERKWQDTKHVLSYFGKGKVGRERYLEYVEKGIELGSRPELVGGGLIRSLGGWSEVLALRKRGKKQTHDQRVLGDGKFVEEIKGKLDKVIKTNLRISGQRIDLEELVKRVCRRDNLSPNELFSGSRRHKLVEARHVVSWVAVHELGYSGADVARYLGVTTSCITRFLSTPEKPDVEEIVKAL